MFDVNDGQINEVIIICKPKENNKDKVRILGKKFIINNEKNCIIIYEGKEYILKNYFEEINNNYNHKNEIIYIIKGINKITNMSSMFEDCNDLTFILIIPNNNSLQTLDKKNENHLKNTFSISPSIESNLNMINDGKRNDSFNGSYSLFYNELSSIFEYSDKNQFNISEFLEIKNISFSLINDTVTDISSIFSGCGSLITLPDISKWNISNVVNMSNMFYGCNELIKIPDISKWNTSNIKDMRNLFYGCNALKRYLIYQNGILQMLPILVLCLLDVIH